MVYLSRIYTKTGDQGDTALGDGIPVPKDHPRVAAYGSVDELNAILASSCNSRTLANARCSRASRMTSSDVGADLCVPAVPDEKPGVLAPRHCRPG